MQTVKIIESPRDGWQGIKKYIPLNQKAEYINTLLEVGFDTIEIGSFVSPVSLPQLADTGNLIKKLNIQDSLSNIMVLIANKKGVELAMKYPEIDYLSFPYSISETFLQKNLKLTKNKAIDTIKYIQESCIKNDKKLVIYITMGFGNPYGDYWNMEIIINTVEILKQIDIQIISFTDITGISKPDIIEQVFKNVIIEFPDIEFGLHLHTTKESYFEKVFAAYKNGCKRFDTVLGGMGGCPFTGKEMLENLDTFDLIAFMEFLNNSFNKLNIPKLKLASDVLKDII